nr:transcriptional regulator [Candidatus Pantoea persica]
MTGVASRYVGMVIGVMLALLGLFPILGALMQQIPPPVLGRAMLVMFGSVVAAGRGGAGGAEAAGHDVPQGKTAGGQKSDGAAYKTRLAH